MSARCYCAAGYYGDGCRKYALNKPKEFMTTATATPILMPFLDCLGCGRFPEIWNSKKLGVQVPQKLNFE